jgi:hypothetical protein
LGLTSFTYVPPLGDASSKPLVTTSVCTFFAAFQLFAFGSQLLMLKLVAYLHFKKLVYGNYMFQKERETESRVERKKLALDH